MLDLRVNGFRRDRILELVSSPFFRFSSQGSTGSKPRPDLWDAASRRLGITKGLEEWRRLTAYLDRDLPLRDDDENDVVGLRIASTHIRNLWSAVSALAQALEPIPEIGTWEEYSEQVLQLCERWLDASGEHGRVDERLPTGHRQLEAGFDGVALAERHPARSVSGGVYRCVASRDGNNASADRPFLQRGVQVLDAMAARGGVFRALYVIGLNEKVFPRTFARTPSCGIVFADFSTSISVSKFKRSSAATMKNNCCSRCSADRHGSSSRSYINELITRGARCCRPAILWKRSG